MAVDQGFFADGDAYERTMGRLSRVAGEKFLDWLSLPGGLRWLDAGCGTGSFTNLLLDRNSPSFVSAIDPSEEQIAFAKGRPASSRVHYRQGDAMELPFGADEFDVAVMALVIQYIPDRTKAMSEMTRVVRQRGTIAAYVWPGRNEGHPMQLLSDAVQSIGKQESRRPGNQMRTIDALIELFGASGLEAIDSRSIGIELEFKDFEDCWSAQPPDNIRDLSPWDTARVKAAFRERLPAEASGRISYTAQANAIRGQVPRR